METAFLVRLSISVWTARKLDKAATKEAKDRSHADARAGVKVYKSVIAAEALDAIATIANAARIEHRKRTVPWAYDGPGAITAAGYPEYKARMATMEKEFHAAVNRFWGCYESERESARTYLGDLFNSADYPSTSELLGKFAFSVHAEPMPQAADFRIVGLPADDIADIKKDIEANNIVALDNANATAWERVIEHVERLKTRLAAYKPAANGEKVEGKFHDSLIENVSELAMLLPSINITNDPDLNRIGQKLTALTAYTAQDLRESDALRADIVKQAGAILASINDAYKRAA